MDTNKRDLATLNRILEIEWNMFQEANAGGMPIACRDDQRAFCGGRVAQFLSWPDDLLPMYLAHLETCLAERRNLAMEKHILMMENVDPETYAALRSMIHFPGEEAKTAADRLTDLLVAETEALGVSYPRIATAGRPLHSGEDSPACLSVETCQRSELYTYSQGGAGWLAGVLFAFGGPRLFFGKTPPGEQCSILWL